jgi:hypothetical protein
MATSKTYGSKEELFRDYEIAIKFVVSSPYQSSLINKRMGQGADVEDDYTPLFAALEKKDQAAITKFADFMKGFPNEYQLSAGYFLEVPLAGPKGEVIGTRFVALPHETGPELFISTIWSAIVPAVQMVGPMVMAPAAGWAVGKSLDLLLKRAKTWEAQLRKRPERFSIEFVEIRTKEKGIMRLPFAELRAEQILCLLGLFPSIQFLWQANQDCFGGKLLSVPDSSPDDR